MTETFDVITNPRFAGLAAGETVTYRAHDEERPAIINRVANADSGVLDLSVLTNDPDRPVIVALGVLYDGYEGVGTWYAAGY